MGKAWLSRPAIPNHSREFWNSCRGNGLALTAEMPRLSRKLHTLETAQREYCPGCGFEIGSSVQHRRVLCVSQATYVSTGCGFGVV
jgi:predicted RNA-binding Zn-ribbon protein involved in translation (DUF1610 family)